MYDLNIQLFVAYWSNLCTAKTVKEYFRL